MSTDLIEDRLAIRELIETFVVGCMRADSGIWGATWAEEGSWKIDMLDEPAVGRANVVAIFDRIMPNMHFVTMTSFPADLVIEGDRAHGKAYCQEVMFPKAGGQKMLAGYYDDEYVKRDGRWYFLSRTYNTMWRNASE